MTEALPSFPCALNSLVPITILCSVSSQWILHAKHQYFLCFAFSSSILKMEIILVINPWSGTSYENSGVLPCLFLVHRWSPFIFFFFSPSLPVSFVLYGCSSTCLLTLSPSLNTQCRCMCLAGFSGFCFLYSFNQILGNKCLNDFPPPWNKLR